MTRLCTHPFTDCRARPCHRQRDLVCRSARSSDKPVDSASTSICSRRNTLIAGVAGLAFTNVGLSRQVWAKEVAEGKTLLPVKSLNRFQKDAERATFVSIVEGELRKELSEEDAPDTVRLVLHDAGTFDVQTRTGGMNGSIITGEEMSRPENKDLKQIIDKLKTVRKNIAENPQYKKNGFALISWADLEVLAAKVANQKAWSKIKRSRGVPSSGDIVSSAFGASWPVRLGRVDKDSPDPEGRIPKPDASVKDITEFFAKLNNKDYGATGFFAPKPIFDQRQAFVLYCSASNDIEAVEARLANEPDTKYRSFQDKYERSRATVTRTDYEVDLIEYLSQLASLGAEFDPDAYFVPIEIDTPKF